VKVSQWVVGSTHMAGCTYVTHSLVSLDHAQYALSMAVKHPNIIAHHGMGCLQSLGASDCHRELVRPQQEPTCTM